MSTKALTVTAIMAILVALPLIFIRRRPGVRGGLRADDLVIENELRYDVEDFLG
jgi:hypothetical protein